MSKLEKVEKLSLYALTWPIFIEITLHMLMGNVDTLMLSRYSDDAVAAVGVANQLSSILIVMFGFVAMGTGIVVSQYVGARNHKKASEVAVVALAVNLVFGLVLSAIMYVFAEQFLTMMSLPGELMDYGLVFVTIVGGFAFVEALTMAMSSTVRSYGYTRDAMYITIGMNVLNIIGNYLVLYGPFGLPQYGVTGVAISTTVARVLGMLATAWLLVRRVEEPLPWAKFFKFPRDVMTSILRIGIPAAGENLMYNASQIMITYFVAMIGTEALTTKVYAQNVMMFVFLFAIAVGSATQIMVGRSVGAGRLEDAYQIGLRNLKISLGVVMVMAVVFSLLREPLMSIFTDNTEIIAMGSTLILMTLILEPGRTFNLVVIAALRAAGDAKFPVYMGVLSMWGFAVSLAYLFGVVLDLGLVGVWIGYTVDEWFRGLLMLWRWRQRKWMTMGFVKPVESEQRSASV